MATMTVQVGDVLRVPYGYSRYKDHMVAVRRMTLAEVKALSAGSHVEFIANDGTLRRLKINGAVQMWKTRPDDVSVPVKYGMYEYWRMDTAEALRRLVVRIEAE